MFNKIVIGVDGLDGGADALALGRMLASPESELVLVHVYPLEIRPSRSAELDYERVVRDDARKRLADLAPSDRATTLLAIGDTSAARALHHAAEEQGADLVVIGSCRRGAVGRVLLGDVSRSVLHGAPCSVAVAPRGFRQHAHRFAVIAAGYNSTPESEAALDLAAGLARELEVPLRVLTAAPAPAPFVPGYAYSFDVPDLGERHRLTAEQALATAVADLDMAAESEVIDDVPAAALERLSEHVGIVVVGSRGWGAARRVVLGSTADHLVHHAHCPVIVTPGPLTQELDSGATAPAASHA